jgi:hypothetical protein
LSAGSTTEGWGARCGGVRRLAGAALALALILVATPGAAMQESVRQAMRYVESLDHDCVYDHGYQCMEIEEDDFTRPDPDRNWVPGPYLEAWSVCHRDFLEIEEMNAEQKRLRHYKIAFTQTPEHFIVLFQGLLLPMLENGEPAGVMRATYGISTKYWVNRETLAIDKRLFLR